MTAAIENESRTVNEEGHGPIFKNIMTSMKAYAKSDGSIMGIPVYIYDDEENISTYREEWEKMDANPAPGVWIPGEEFEELLQDRDGWKVPWVDEEALNESD